MLLSELSVKGFIDGRAFIAGGAFIFCSLLLLFLFLQLIQLVCLADKGIGRIGYFCHSIRERLNFSEGKPGD